MPKSLNLDLDMINYGCIETSVTNSLFSLSMTAVSECPRLIPNKYKVFFCMACRNSLPIHTKLECDLEHILD